MFEKMKKSAAFAAMVEVAGPWSQWDRAAHITYGLIRGVKYHQIERCSNDAPPTYQVAQYLAKLGICGMKFNPDDKWNQKLSVEQRKTFYEEFDRLYAWAKKAMPWTKKVSRAQRKADLEALLAQEGTLHTSPSGNYSLKIVQIPTKPGCWNYSAGIVTDTRTGKLVRMVRRNYGSFPFLFLTTNGHEYLVCGENYQGQMVIELDTKRVRKLLPREAKKGFGFCWASYEFHEAAKVLIVDGCYWACPYQYKFFDFADPMNGWPELLEKEDIDPNRTAVSAEADGTIMVKEFADTDDDFDDVPVESRTVVAYRKFVREGKQLVQKEAWIEPAEKERRDIETAEHQAREAALRHYQQTDPTYLNFKAVVNASKILKPSKYTSYMYGAPAAKGCELPGAEKSGRIWCRTVCWEQDVHLEIRLYEGSGLFAVNENCARSNNILHWFRSVEETVQFAESLMPAPKKEIVS